MSRYAKSSIWDMAASGDRDAQARLAAERARAWQDHGVVVVRPDEISNDWLRQGLINHANAAHGKRRA